MRKKRHPRELLKSLRDKAEDESLNWQDPGRWKMAAAGTANELNRLLLSLPPDPPRRSYYGHPGSLRNPSHKSRR